MMTHARKLCFCLCYMTSHCCRAVGSDENVDGLDSSVSERADYSESRSESKDTDSWKADLSAQGDSEVCFVVHFGVVRLLSEFAGLGKACVKPYPRLS